MQLSNTSVPSTAAAADTGPIDEPSHDGSHRRMPAVLLVSPDVHVLHVMQSSLNRAGFEVDTALRADIAQRLSTEIDYDALVIDEGEGVQALCRDVLSRPAAPCVLMMSEAGARDTLPEGAERLEKPLSLRYLTARLIGQFGYFPISA